MSLSHWIKTAVFPGRQLSLFDQGSVSTPSFDPLFIYKTRLRHSWYVQWKPGEKQGRLSVPYAVKHAPEEVKHQLRKWGQLKGLPSRKLGPSEKLQLHQIEERVMGFLDNPLKEIKSQDVLLDSQLKRWLGANGKKASRLNAVGKFHHLDELFQWINESYFGGTLRARLTWSPRVGGQSTHSLQVDGRGRPYHLISISRAYDFEDVTREIVGGVVYHECLHIAIPPYLRNGRRIVHGPEFRRRERAYPFYSEWIHWHRTQMGKKLRLLRRKK